ncbi:MAG: dihydrofolate reductase family protein [Candidatus Pacebacteria bacterium]|nr:dihydrofolate reductase family protein [Candidatus Paceibacterota bacterium]
MSKIILYIAQSLDGYISTKDGSVSWLDEFNNTGEDLGFNDFIDGIDVDIQGSKTYQQVLDFDIPYPYTGKSFVLTNRNDLEKPSGVDIEFYSGELANLVDKAKSVSKKNVWLIGGANVVQQFLKESLIDEIILFTMPVVLGDGISLFNKTKLVKTKLINSNVYDSGIIMSHYKL